MSSLGGGEVNKLQLKDKIDVKEIVLTTLSRFISHNKGQRSTESHDHKRPERTACIKGDLCL